MFSSRLDWAQRPNALAQALAARRLAGGEILDLTESNPTREFPIPSAVASLADARVLRYEPDPRGLLSAREAVCSYYQGRVASDRVLLTASTSEAYSYLFHLLCNPGDEVLTPRPSYPLFDYLAGLASVNLRQYPLEYDGAWHVDFDALSRAITPRTRAVVVVNPNNPTGSFLKPDEAEALDALAARHNLAILSDEVFSDYAFADYGFGAAPAWPTATALTFHMSGLSKIAALPQMKLGWIVAEGPQAAPALEALELIADTFLSVATPVQLALPELLAASGPVREMIRTRTAANLAQARTALAGSAATLLNTEGGWYAIAQVPRTRTEEQWCLDLLNHASVWLQPGYYFDFATEAFLVMSLLTNPATFAEGLRRLRQFL